MMIFILVIIMMKNTLLTLAADTPNPELKLKAIISAPYICYIDIMGIIQTINTCLIHIAKRNITFYPTNDIRRDTTIILMFSSLLE